MTSELNIFAVTAKITASIAVLFRRFKISMLFDVIALLDLQTQEPGSRNSNKVMLIKVLFTAK